MLGAAANPILPAMQPCGRALFGLGANSLGERVGTATNVKRRASGEKVTMRQQTTYFENARSSLQGLGGSFAVEKFIGILTEEPVKTAQEVFHRCEAAEALAKLGPAAPAATPALIRTLVVPVTVDCWLALRVAAAEAVWKVGGRLDLALPFLAWALKDEYWGVSRKAAQVLGEMGPVAHDAIPDLARLADRRSAHGPFHFEQFEPDAGNPETSSLLAIVAIALGRCGRGIAHFQEARRILTQLTASQEEDARTAALQALEGLGTLDG